MIKYDRYKSLKRNNLIQCVYCYYPRYKPILNIYSIILCIMQPFFILLTLNRTLLVLSRIAHTKKFFKIKGFNNKNLNNKQNVI